MDKSVYIPYDMLKLAKSSTTMTISKGLLNGDDITSLNITNNGVCLLYTSDAADEL